MHFVAGRQAAAAHFGQQGSSDADLYKNCDAALNLSTHVVQ